MHNDPNHHEPMQKTLQHLHISAAFHPIIDCAPRGMEFEKPGMLRQGSA
jgi:hypothetical protein